MLLSQCLPCRRSSLDLPLEILDAIFRNFDFKLLYTVSQLSKREQEAVKLHLRDRYVRMLRKYLKDPACALQFLREHGGVVSGMSANLYLLAENSVDHHALELHVSAGDVSSFKPTLDGEGYVALPAESSYSFWLDHRSGGRRVRSVEVFHRPEDRQRIVVFTSPTPIAICSVFSQPCSAAFTFIAADYIFIGYPRLTLAGRAIVNPWKMGQRMTRRYLDQLRRFSSELFDIAHSSAAWDTSHICYSTDGCPSSRRSSHDKDSLFFDFTPSVQAPDSRIADWHPSFTWRLGGHTCEATRIPRARAIAECSLEVPERIDEDKLFFMPRRFR